MVMSVLIVLIDSVSGEIYVRGLETYKVYFHQIVKELYFCRVWGSRYLAVTFVDMSIQAFDNHDFSFPQQK